MIFLYSHAYCVLNSGHYALAVPKLSLSPFISSVGSVHPDFRRGGRWFNPRLGQ